MFCFRAIGVCRMNRRRIETPRKGEAMGVGVERVVEPGRASHRHAREHHVRTWRRTQVLSGVDDTAGRRSLVRDRRRWWGQLAICDARKKISQVGLAAGVVGLWISHGVVVIERHEIRRNNTAPDTIERDERFAVVEEAVEEAQQRLAENGCALTDLLQVNSRAA